MEDFHMWATFAVIAAAVVAYVSEKVPLELTAVSVLVAFLLLFEVFPFLGPDGTRIVTSDQLLAGFANSALFTVLALLVIGQGLFQTGALDGFAQRVGQWGGGRTTLTTAVVLVATGVLSAFMNNTPVVVLMLPVLGAVALRARMSPSKVMIPLSFVSILGREGANILEVSHQRLLLDVPAMRATTDITVETRDRDHAERIRAALEAGGMTVSRLVPKQRPDG